MLLNTNLPPSKRVKKENLIINMVIPGPKSPKDFNSFLRPLVDELKQLECNFFKILNYMINSIKYIN